MKTQNKTSDIDKLRTKRFVADAFQISTCSVDRLRKSGKLRSVKIGGLIRFRESEIKRFIEESS